MRRDIDKNPNFCYRQRMQISDFQTRNNALIALKSRQLINEHCSHIIEETPYNEAKNYLEQPVQALTW